MSPSVLVTVCTYKRPDDLSALLDSLVPALAGTGADLLVVDNDAGRSAEQLVQTHPAGARYKVCPDAGIAQARNAALEERKGYDYIAFIDDDETVDEDWFSELLSGAISHHADIATGPVISIFPPGTPEWIIRGGFVQRPRRATGTSVDIAATNNTLIRNSVLDEIEDPWFDVSFSRSGGSDAELTSRIARQGKTIIWIDSAVVREVMPLDRLTLRWIIKRMVRVGNVRGRLLSRDKSRRELVTMGARGMLLGAFLVTRSVVSRRGLVSGEVYLFANNFGILRAGLGGTVYEYARG